MKLDPPTADFLIKVSTYSHTLSSALFTIDSGNCLAYPTMLKSSLPLLRKRLLPVPKIFSSKKNIICQFIFSKCIQKHTEYDLFVCGDTLCLMASVYSLRRLFMNYNESTHQKYVLTRSDDNLLFGFYFFLFYFLKSWTFFPFTTRRFREFLRLFPFGADLYFSFFFACSPPFLLFLQCSFSSFFPLFCF